MRFFSKIYGEKNSKNLAPPGTILGMGDSWGHSANTGMRIFLFDSGRSTTQNIILTVCDQHRATESINTRITRFSPRGRPHTPFDFYPTQSTAISTFVQKSVLNNFIGRSGDLPACFPRDSGAFVLRMCSRS